MAGSSRLLFIHGKDGSSQGFKVQYPRRLYHDPLAPDFPGDFWQRMTRLEQVIGDAKGWTIVGSGIGGFVAAVFACQHHWTARLQTSIMDPEAQLVCGRTAWSVM